MSTREPLRRRMLAVSAAKRGCGLMHSSGTKSEVVTGPPGLRTNPRVRKSKGEEGRNEV